MIDTHLERIIMEQPTMSGTEYLESVFGKRIDQPPSSIRGILQTKEYDRFMILNDMGDLIHEFQGAKAANKCFPGDHIAWINDQCELELRDEHPLIVGTLELTSKSTYGMTKRKHRGNTLAGHTAHQLYIRFDFFPVNRWPNDCSQRWRIHTIGRARLHCWHPIPRNWSVPIHDDDGTRQAGVYSNLNHNFLSKGIARHESMWVQCVADYTGANCDHHKQIQLTANICKHHEAAYLL
jgi:hypothetical protein